MRTQGIRNEELGIRNFLGTDEHGFYRPQMVFYRPQINTDWHRLRAKGSD